MLRKFRDKIPEGLDAKVFRETFLPEALPLDDVRRADITLGQLLCMTGGYHGEGQSPTAVVLGRVMRSGDPARAASDWPPCHRSTW